MGNSPAAAKGALIAGVLRGRRLEHRHEVGAETKCQNTPMKNVRPRRASLVNAPIT